MNRIIPLLLCLLSSINIYSQENTYYFKLSKILNYGIEDINVSGGQFITIGNYYCYDSNIRGEDIGNGILYKQSDNPSGIQLYSGDCYYGKALYKFKDDLSILNIEINRSLIYVYKQSSPPNGQTTSTLIKGEKGDINSETSSSAVIPPYSTHRQSNTPVQPPHWNLSSGTNSNQRQKTIVRKKCPYCSGAGEKIQHEYIPTYGTNGARVYCSKCNRSWSAGTVHAHHPCRHCNGLGYTEYTY